MNLLDLYEQREPYQQNIDELEYRRMNDLRDKMQDLMQDYRQATTDSAKNAIMARYNEYKAEREGYGKVREGEQIPSKMDQFGRPDAFAHVKDKTKATPGIPGNVPVEKIPGKEDLLKGRGRSYYEATGDDIKEVDMPTGKKIDIVNDPDKVRPITTNAQGITTGAVYSGNNKPNLNAKCRVCQTSYNKHFRFGPGGKILSSTVRGPCGRIPQDFPDLRTSENTSGRGYYEGATQGQAVVDEQTAPQSHAVGVYYEILKAWEDERDYIAIPFPDGRSATMIRGQIWNAIVTFHNIKDNKRRAKYVQQHLDTFETFMPWLSSLQRYKVPAKRRIKQQSLDLQPRAVTTSDAAAQTAEPAISTDVKLPNLQEKKKSIDLDAKDVRLSRQLQTARARFPTASSDVEAGILDQIDQQDQTVKTLAQQQADINRQDQQMVALTQANQAQSAQISTQGQEIDRLTQRLQQTMQTIAPVTTTTRSTGTPDSATVAKSDVIDVPGEVADTSQQDAEITKLNQKIMQIQQQIATASGTSQELLLDKIAELEKARAEQEAKKQATAEKRRITRRAATAARTVDTTPAQAQGQLGLINPNDPMSINLDPQDQVLATAAAKEAGKVIARAKQKKVSTTETSVAEGNMKSQDTLRRELAYYGDKKFGQIYGMTSDEINRIKNSNVAQDMPIAAPRFRDAQGRAQLEAKTDSRSLRQQLAMKYRELAPAITPGRDTYLAGQLYDALEDIAQQHGAMSEFRKIMDSARNRAHMEYDTNPGGFHNWFQFLPFADDNMLENSDDVRKKLQQYLKLALAANRAGDDAKCKSYQQKIQLLKQKLSEGRVSNDVGHRGDVDTSANIEVLGVDFANGTFDITYNDKPYQVKTQYFSKEGLGRWQIPDYDIDIINGKGKNIIDLIDFDNDRQVKMVNTIIAYLDTQQASDIQYMAWRQAGLENSTAEELYQEIQEFYKNDKKNINKATAWLVQNMQDAEQQQVFADYVKNPVSTPAGTKYTPKEYLMYVAFAYSREGNTELTPGMNLPTIQLSDPDNEEEFYSKVDELFKKVQFKFDAFENKIIELADSHGLGSDPDLGSGFGQREMIWDHRQKTTSSSESNINRQQILARAILNFQANVKKYVESFNNTLIKIGLPGIGQYSTWSGVLGDQLTDQQVRYFDTPEGFANLATGKVDLAKMLDDNVEKLGLKEQDVEEGEQKPTTRRELLDRIDRIQRMMTQDRDPANVHRMKKDIEQLKQRYQHLKEDLGNEAVEIAIMRRILIQHTDLIQAHGLDRVVAAIEDVAEDVGEVDEIGSSDVSAYVRSVMRDLQPDAEDLLREKKWSARYKSSINCANPKGFSQKAHCAGKQK